MNLFSISFFSALDISKEFDPDVSSTIVHPSQFSSSLHKGKDENDTNCWTSPGGSGFMIRGKNYLRDHSKVYIIYFAVIHAYVHFMMLHYYAFFFL